MTADRRKTERRALDEAPHPADLERTLPHNHEAERSVLGAILVHNDAFEKVADILTPAHFYRDAHRRLYAAIERLVDRKTIVDFVTLKEELVRVGDLEDVGGPAYVAGLADGVPRATNVEYYGRIVREKAMLRGVIYAANKVLSMAYEGEEDAGAILQKADRAFLDVGTHSGQGRMTSLESGMDDVFNRINYRHEHRGELSGVDTGFASINDETLGWQPGDLNIIAARPSIGKTAFLLNSIIAASQGPQKTRTAVFSLEMRRSQLENRILAILSGVDAHRIRSGHLGDMDFKALAPAGTIMAGLPIWIDDRAGRTVPEIRSICRRLKADNGLDLIAIDYVQLLAGSLDRRGGNRNEEVTDIATRLKDLADELTLPVVLLSQLTRANEKRDDPRPKLSDLRESGALEQVADIVAFLHRRNHKEGGTTNFILEKQRNGPTGTMNLTFDRDTQRITDGGEDPPEPPPKERKGKKKRAPGPAGDDPRLPD